MQIPLDYYRILGLPIQTSAEQLQQAYRDRTLQLPRREYSQAAIAARKQLLEQAYAVLSDPEQRAWYDANYFAYTYDHEDDYSEATEDENRPELIKPAISRHTPSIDIPDELFVGALLILQELGEYELVLKLGPNHLNAISAEIDGEKSNLDVPDIILTIALASLELGREQWQQGQYENAASSLENGQNLLIQEQLFPNIRNEIQADLYKLRPYRILELLAQPASQVAERRSLGLKLLQELLDQRGGIDGTKDDGSGLSLDDFLRFIQQLRSYLTAAEQQTLFAAESQRPSAVATYLTAYTLIARGFAQRQPILISQAKLLLMRLGKRQDVHLEQAVCSLLLGQTAEASRALELSQEYETLAFIRENSQADPDLLPGLCLYSDRWLQTEVFPQFQDLAHQQASLKDYFANKQVQAYLEALPAQVETTAEKARVESKSSTQPKLTASRPSEPEAQSSAIASSGVAIMPAAERTTKVTSQTTPNTTSLAQIQSPQQSRRRTRNRIAHELSMGSTGGALAHRQDKGSALVRTVLNAKKTRLMLVATAGLLGIVVFWFLASQTFAWLKQTLFPPAPSLQGEQLLVQLNQPPLPIPSAGSELLAEEPLNQKMAEQVIQTWLSAKKAAFGSNHAVDNLKQILVQPALSQWQQRVEKDKANNRYRQYQHTLKIESVTASAAAPDQTQVEATVKEMAQVYENAQLMQNASYDDTVRVRYDLVRQDSQWRIREMTVLK
ncbi:MAG: DUF4101 domain-containing protein [Gloeocapsa sp. UFS-A4-WI-NPMV-4B04]|jgi:curved DNA-binding protein CbpA|nr:DUF4101 domain-containing protein [Gloeocapsa sp. UFS-A4-WI-NPMV-4B04]